MQTYFGACLRFIYWISTGTSREKVMKGSDKECNWVHKFCATVRWAKLSLKVEELNGHLSLVLSVLQMNPNDQWQNAWAVGQDFCGLFRLDSCEREGTVQKIPRCRVYRIWLSSFERHLSLLAQFNIGSKQNIQAISVIAEIAYHRPWFVKP